MSLYEQSRDRNWANRFSSPVKAVPRDAGLGVSKPTGQAKDQLGTGSPMPEKKKEDYESNPFYKSWQEAMGKDPTFKRMNDEMMALTAGLREDVKRGEMPMHIAEKRLREAMEDQRYNAGVDREGFNKMMEVEEKYNGNA
ncbi:hypothetical protein PQC39_gp129 [Vibrio phage Vp_R1]|uniref:Uncharacterized protein n=1 Tax=Vibrio phage Vp_R1 TaxID=2059867 RepID=A0A2H5BQ79_9CAUD|nr:hypothetical protein PQC39_gp129 [Vibrio phage Vp_R1]AUG88493.1 hypothetical protein VPR_129 [Vibrio phage Vp_R1]